MTVVRKLALLSASALSATLVASPATAQQAAPQAAADTDTAQEIIVTAQKREQSLQSVPIAVSAFTDKSLQDRRIDNAINLGFSVPNLTVTDSGATLRGVGNLAISTTSDSGLGYHVNGVPITLPATELEYFDLARIEVLRGPQGTLYGRNTTAGVINIITQKATNRFEGYVQGTYGNYNNVKLNGAINIPLGPVLSERIAGIYLRRDGYTTNLFNGHKIDGREFFSVRSSTHLDAGDTTGDLIVNYFHEKDNRAYISKAICTKDPVTGCSGTSAGFGTPDARTTIFSLIGNALGLIPRGVDYFANSINPTNVRQVSQDVDPTYYVREWNASLEINHDFGDLKLTSLSGYQEITRDIFNDFDRFSTTVTLPVPVTYDLYGNGTTVTSNQIQSGRRDFNKAREYYTELRLASSFKGPFNFLVGANYIDYNTYYLLHITSPLLAILAQVKGLPAQLQDYEIETKPTTAKSYGIFGEAYYNLNDATKLTLGLRYSHDKKHIVTRQTFQFDNPPIPPYTIGDFQKGAVTGRLVLDHKFGTNVLGYVSLSRGYKAGGINPGGATVPSFKPEYLNAAEVGLKSRTADGVLTFNATGFYYDYKDLQIGQVGVTSANTVNTNATIYGLELETIIRPNHDFQIDANASYLQTRISNFQSADQGDPLALSPGTVIVRDASGNAVKASDGSIIKNLDGNQLPFSPHWKFSVGMQNAFHAGKMVITPRGDLYFQGNYYGSEFNKVSDRLKGYTQVDLKLMIAPESGPWQLRAYVKNLLDSNDIVRLTQEGPLVGRFRDIFPLEPRTYGLELTYRF